MEQGVLHLIALYVMLYIWTCTGSALPSGCKLGEDILCCDGANRLTDNNTTTLRCCGNKVYDSTAQLCCVENNNISSIVYNVSDPTMYDCCGSKMYAKSTQHCDNVTTTVTYLNVSTPRSRRSLSCAEGRCCDGTYITLGKEHTSHGNGVFGCSCCGKTAYNVLIEECCSPDQGIVARTGEICCNGKAVNGTGGMVCCGDQPINLRHKRCCHKYGRKGRLLRTAAYDLATEQCCGGEVISAVIPCCNQKWPMDKKRQVCCPYHGPRNKTNPLQDACCEDQWINFVQPYDSRTEVCLHNEVKKRDAMCKDGMVLCGTTCYHPDTDICCHDDQNPEEMHQLYSKLTDGDKCCGGKAYFSWSQSCCNGHLYNTSLLKCCCDGKIPYDPFTEKCLERKKKPTSCKVVGCPVQILNKQQLGSSKEHLLTNKWLVAKTRSVVQPKLDDDFIQFSAVIISSKQRKDIRIKVLRGCHPTLIKQRPIFLLRAEKARKHKTVIFAAESDYFFKRKGFYQRAKKCVNALLKGKTPAKRKECRTLLRKKKG